MLFNSSVAGGSGVIFLKPRLHYRNDLGVFTGYKSYPITVHSVM